MFNYIKFLLKHNSNNGFYTIPGRTISLDKVMDKIHRQIRVGNRRAKFLNARISIETYRELTRFYDVEIFYTKFLHFEGFTVSW